MKESEVYKLYWICRCVEQSLNFVSAMDAIPTRVVVPPMALDLHLDPAIRTWVFLPIVVIVFTVSIIRHYAVLLFRGETKATIEKIQENQYLTKSRLLRANGHLLPGKSFQMRQKFHTDEESGFIASRRQAPKENVSMSPDMLSQQLTGQLLNTIPTILIGTWINYTFSGFVTTRMPFPLTRNFTVMLQRGVNLTSLDASWVGLLSCPGRRKCRRLCEGDGRADEDECEHDAG
ncbi:hypothetical protein QR680_016550 [Steinernema hermaphroditum]|uniref:ER membrane protein complex subunit 3 n=1 Tax=Steinernema hermaphroditum TaxID=289476 RepID=A0AA39LMI2_9BILA|nr:hypothetical protein QR680_016550 [Steinernema hermaphroditum]